ncbi:MAG: YciI family protein [Saprospiraceae bacterium]
MDHVQYMATFGTEKLVMGGPFLDNSGGMMIYNCETIEEAQKIANDDPTVKSGLLNVEVKQWMVAMQTIEN